MTRARFHAQLRAQAAAVSPQHASAHSSPAHRVDVIARGSVSNPRLLSRHISGPVAVPRASPITKPILPIEASSVAGWEDVHDAKPPGDMNNPQLFTKKQRSIKARKRSKSPIRPTSAPSARGKSTPADAVPQRAAEPISATTVTTQVQLCCCIMHLP